MRRKHKNEPYCPIGIPQALVDRGNLKVQYIKSFSDVTRPEAFIQTVLLVATLIMGIYPEIFLDPMHVSVANLLEDLHLRAYGLTSSL